MRQWIKLFSEVIDDPKLNAMTWEERGVFMYLLAACGKIDDKDSRGELTGRLMPLDELAWYMRCDVALLSKAVATMVALGVVSVEADGVLRLVNFKKRQAQAEQKPMRRSASHASSKERGYRVVSDKEWRQAK